MQRCSQTLRHPSSRVAASSWPRDTPISSFPVDPRIDPSFDHDWDLAAGPAKLPADTMWVSRRDGGLAHRWEGQQKWTGSRWRSCFVVPTGATR